MPFWSKSKAELRSPYHPLSKARCPFDMLLIMPDKHCKRIPSRFEYSTGRFGVRTVRMEAVECWRCGSVELLDVTGVDESDIRRYECMDCSVCDSCRHYEGYRCADWPTCHYEI